MGLADTIAAYIREQRERDAAPMKLPRKAAMFNGLDYAIGWDDCIAETKRLNAAPSGTEKEKSDG